MTILSKVTLNKASVAAVSGDGETVGDTCTGAVKTDDMNSLDTTLWSENDVSGIMDFANGRWEWNSSGYGIATLDGEGVFTLSGDIDLCMKCDIDALNYTTDNGFQNCYIQLTFTEGYKQTSSFIRVKGQNNNDSDPSPGNLKIEAFGTGGSLEKMTTPPGGTGAGSSHIFRITVDDATNVATLYVWNQSLTRWEWNGDIGGYTVSGFDSTVTDISIRFDTYDANDYIDGGVDYFYINSGTYVEL